MSNSNKKTKPSAKRRQLERASPRDKAAILKEEAERQAAETRRKERLKHQ